jgi:urate oxidase
MHPNSNPSTSSASFRLGPNRYGKARVRVARVTRQPDGVHQFRELSVDVLAEGDFDTSYTAGDNSAVLPTDTMKNTVYVLAKEHGIESPEAFGLLAANYFLERNPAMERVEIAMRETRWERLAIQGAPHPHAFRAPGFGRPMARIAVRRGGEAELESGIDDLCLLKTTGSGFVEFRKDEWTTLPESTDRILSTLLAGRWIYERPPAAWQNANQSVMDAMLEVFATQYSPSVQSTLYAMAGAALEAVPELAQVTLRMPNRHYFTYDLQKLGLTNDGEVFYPTDEPHGQIEATVLRG